MSITIEGFNNDVPASPTWTTLSASTERRCVFLQTRVNIYVRRVSDPATFIVVLGETSGSVVDLGVIAPADIEVQAISSAGAVSMYSLDPSERR